MNWIKLIVYNLIIFAILFIGIEMVYRIFNPDYQYYEQTVFDEFKVKAIAKMDTNWVQPDLDLGWVARSDKSIKFYRSDFDSIDYTINNQGFRNEVDFDSLGVKNKKRILMLGDSFVFGILQEDSVAISNKLSELLASQFEIYNLAIPGWGMDQMYLAFQKYAAIIQPDIVILNIIDDDLTRVAESFYWGASTKPSFQVENGELKRRGKKAGSLNAIEKFLFFQSKVLNNLYRKYIIKRTKPVVQLLAQEFIAKVQYNSAKLIIVRHPRIEQLIAQSPPSDLLPSDYLNQLEISYFDLQDTLRQLSSRQLRSFFIPEDGHWSKEGVAIMSEILVEKIRKMQN